jgi:hypothetical protein
MIANRQIEGVSLFDEVLELFEHNPIRSYFP